VTERIVDLKRKIVTEEEMHLLSHAGWEPITQKQLKNGDISDRRLYKKLEQWKENSKMVYASRTIDGQSFHKFRKLRYKVFRLDLKTPIVQNTGIYRPGGKYEEYRISNPIVYTRLYYLLTITRTKGEEGETVKKIVYSIYGVRNYGVRNDTPICACTGRLSIVPKNIYKVPATLAIADLDRRPSRFFADVGDQSIF
jgi:hypothetical protein